LGYIHQLLVSIFDWTSNLYKLFSFCCDVISLLINITSSSN